MDRDGTCFPPPVRAPAAVLNKLRMIAEELAREARGLLRESSPETDRVGVLLSKGLRMGLPAQAAESLRDADAPMLLMVGALGDLRSLWIEVGAVEYAIVRALDGELAAPSYARFGSLRRTVVDAAANVLVSGRLLERPAEFLLIEALFNQHDGLARAVEFYAAALRGNTNALRKTQLVVLTRLARAAAALWIIDARLEALYGCSPA